MQSVQRSHRQAEGLEAGAQLGAREAPGAGEGGEALLGLRGAPSPSNHQGQRRRRRSLYGIVPELS